MVPKSSNILASSFHSQIYAKKIFVSHKYDKKNHFISIFALAGSFTHQPNSIQWRFEPSGHSFVSKIWKKINTKLGSCKKMTTF